MKENETNANLPTFFFPFRVWFVYDGENKEKQRNLTSIRLAIIIFLSCYKRKSELITLLL